MVNKKFWIMMLALITALAVAFACGGGDDDDDDDDADVDPGMLHGFVRDFQTKTEVNNALVELVDDVTGEILDIEPFTTGPTGEVSFEDLGGRESIGVRVTKEGSMDTIQFHFQAGDENEEFLLINNGTKDLMLLSLALEMDETKGVVAGGVYWGDPTDENAIGCSMVSFDPDDGQPIYYFGPDALPNAARSVSGDTPANGQGTLDATAPSDGHALSYYVSLNKDIGSDVNLMATTYNVESNGTADAAQQETNIIPMLYANTATIVNVYFSKDDYAANPTPDWCTE